MEVYSYLPHRPAPIPDDSIELRVSPYLPTIVVAGCRIVSIPHGVFAAVWHGAPCTTFDGRIISVAVPIPALLAAGLDPGVLTSLLDWNCVVGLEQDRKEDVATARRWALPGAAVSVAEVVARLSRLSPAPSGEIQGISEVLKALPAARCLRDVADALLERPDSLNRRFRKALGCGLWRYAIRLEIARARRLLLVTDKSLADVASATGFTSVQAMNCAFRRAGSVSPTQYRSAAAGRLVPPTVGEMPDEDSEDEPVVDWRAALLEDLDQEP